MKKIILSLIPLAAILLLPGCTTVVHEPVPVQPRTTSTTVEETTHVHPLSGSTSIETHSTHY